MQRMMLGVAMVVATQTLLAAAPITGCPDFEIDPPRPAASAPVVRAADYGLSESGDKNAAAINRALAAAKRLGASRVELAPGTYRCFDEAGVSIEGFSDFVFDGKGATLVFRRTCRNSEKKYELVHGGANVNVIGCTRTEVGNFNLDWDWQGDPLGFWCRVAARHEDERDNESYLDLALEKPHPRYPADVPVQMLTPMADSHFGARPVATRGSRYYFGGNQGHWGSKSLWLSPTRLRVWPYVAAEGHFIARDQAGRFSPQANRRGVERCDTNGLFHVIHYYYGLNGVNLHGNAHLTLKDVEIWACRGFGVETSGPQHHWQLVNVNIRPKPGSDYPITATADAHHVAQMQGFFKMIDCDTTMHQDDHFNLHDRTQIGWSVGADRIEIVNNRGVEFAGFEPGQEIELRQDDYAKTGWIGRIVAIDGEIVRFDRPLPRQAGKFFVLFNRTYGVEKVLFRSCRFHDAPWSRGLMMGYDVTFDGCTFGPMVGSVIRFQSCYTYNVWCEGIGCRNIVVRNCRFENCLDAYTLSGDGGTVATLFTGVRMPWKDDAPQRHTPIRHEGLRKVVADYEAKGARLAPSADAISGILVEDCEFVNPRGYLWYVMNGDNLVFRNNRIVSDHPACEPLPYAGRLLVTGGTNIDFPPDLTDSRRASLPCAASGANTRESTHFRGLRAEAAKPTERVRGFLWLEAENFSEYGDWEVDTQFTHKMGSAYLICPGLAKPRPRAAKTTIDVPRAGTWQVWVRTKDWVPEHSPGKFALEVAGRRSPVLGASGLPGWRWEKAGPFELAAGRTEVALVDLSGAFARCDAILLTEDAAYVPPAEDEPLARERMRMTGVDQTVRDVGTYDFVVVGAGAGGMGAAVSAARLGAKVALVYDRPVPGGNGSREMGIGLDGAQMSRKGSREAGLAEEFRMRAARLGVPGLAYEEVLDEMKDVIAGFPNERVMRVEKEGRRITAVVSRNTLTGKWSRYRARLFADATGDGWVAKFAGARLMYGREDKKAFGEDWTVDVADRLTMSGTVMGGCMGMRVKRVPAGAEVAPFHAPAWAKVLPRPFWRPQKQPGSDWWLENPGRIDDIDDPEGARDNLIRIAFDYWDWQCNEWEHREMTRGYCLDYVPYHNARREGMRVVGDYILTGNDCVTEKVFPDAVATGGWSCDVHDPLGMENPKSDGWNLVHKGGPGPYTVPYRMLYSADVDNLFLSSRCFSMTHIALGSMRVGGSIMSAAQAVGTAAAFCLRRGLMPREYGQRHLDELRNRLFRDDLNIQWLADTDPANLALKARASDSGLNDGIGVPEWKGAGTVANYHGWASEEKTAQLTWEKPVFLAEVGIAFDTGLKTRRVKLPMPEELVRDYTVELRSDGAWREIARVTDNDRRYRVHRLPRMQADALRVTVIRTWGDKLSRILEIRAYDSGCFKGDVPLDISPRKM